MKERYGFFYAMLWLVLAVIVLKLCQLQLIDGADYAAQSERRLTRTVTVEAARGEMQDRYGRAIVSNRMGFGVQIQKLRNQSDADINDLLYRLHQLLALYHETVESALPIEPDETGTQLQFQFEESEEELRAKEIAWLTKRGYDENATAQSVFENLAAEYGVETAGKSLPILLRVVATRYDMAQTTFNMNTPFSLLSDASLDLVTALKEQSNAFRGVNIVTQSVREYAHDGVAAHLLGRVGLISSEEYQERQSEGYSFNSRIGKQGLEKYLEDYLRGEDGISSVEQTSGGFSIDATVQKAAVSGKNVTLTLDLELQTLAEEALQRRIAEIRAGAGSTLGGCDADAGAVVVLDVNSGEVLAMASYPSYNVPSFSKDYSSLLENPAKPLFNRALAGTYAPASTYKMLVALGALSEGVITTEEQIYDSGKYTFFRDYQPACWLYNQSNMTHGYVNVSQAIRDSCNVFFYETGRRLTIEQIAEYAEKFGFGQKTGIELEEEERSGNIACPENREKSGGIWYPGDTLQAAIGQSDNLMTPIQIANYIATIANGGTRYRPHLVKSVQGAGADGEDLEFAPEVVEKIEMEPEYWDAVRQGMRMAITEGSTAASFYGSTVPMAGKTGSGQVSELYTNGLFAVYAPYDNPQIAVVAVVEKTSGGSSLAPLVREIVEGYFNPDGEDDSAARSNRLTR